MSWVRFPLGSLIFPSHRKFQNKQNSPSSLRALFLAWLLSKWRGPSPKIDSQRRNQLYRRSGRCSDDFWRLPSHLVRNHKRSKKCKSLGRRILLVGTIFDAMNIAGEPSGNRQEPRCPRIGRCDQREHRQPPARRLADRSVDGSIRERRRANRAAYRRVGADSHPNRIVATDIIVRDYKRRYEVKKLKGYVAKWLALLLLLIGIKEGVSDHGHTHEETKVPYYPLKDGFFVVTSTSSTLR